MKVVESNLSNVKRRPFMNLLFVLRAVLGPLANLPSKLMRALRYTFRRARLIVLGFAMTANGRGFRLPTEMLRHD